MLLQYGHVVVRQGWSSERHVFHGFLIWNLFRETMSNEDNYSKMINRIVVQLQTFDCISVSIAMQFLHFRNAEVRDL